MEAASTKQIRPTDYYQSQVSVERYYLPKADIGQYWYWVNTDIESKYQWNLIVYKYSFKKNYVYLGPYLIFNKNCVLFIP